MEGQGCICIGGRAPISPLLFRTLHFPPCLLCPVVHQDSEGDGEAWDSLPAGARGASSPVPQLSDSRWALALPIDPAASTTGLGAPWGLSRSVWAPSIRLAPAGAE